jgi:D-methionine transport system permease protein
VTLVATVIILIIVFIVQGIGDFLTKRTDKR